MIKYRVPDRLSICIIGRSVTDRWEYNYKYRVPDMYPIVSILTSAYLFYSGKICEKACIREEGCRLHWKLKKRILCNECDKPTTSTFGRCPLHIRGYYVSQHYFRH